MFERTLQDLIRGLRAHKHSSRSDLDLFLQEALKEIREELKGKDMDLKSEAVVKMCYLMMLYPIPPPPSFAFYVVEVMSSPRYHLKQLGYLAAPMAFSESTEEVVLTVNGIRKDLLSPHPHIPPLALAGLSDIMTPALAREVCPDIVSLLTHSKANVRKRAVLAMFKVFEKWPEALAERFPRLRERLEDDDPGVVSATVNVITELSRKSNPKNYLPLAPQLFELLTTSTNNWMLIKIVKLFATLTPIEPRLVRKLLPPLTNLISTTPAISLLYECVRTCIVGGMLDPDTEAGDALASVCVEKLSGFLGDDDQNLKYIALLAMAKIVPTHPHLISEHQEEILKSLDDQDLSIRMRALELASSMVDRDNVREIVSQLLSHLVPSSSTATTTNASSSLPSAANSLALSADDSIPATNVGGATTPATASPAYRLEIVRRILKMTSVDTYAHISDFEWYFSLLMDLTYVSNVDVGYELKEAMLDVVSRVRSLRPFAVALLSRLLGDDTFLENTQQEGGCSEVLAAAAWVCGEYSSDLRNPAATIRDLLRPQIIFLRPWILAHCIMAATKIFGNWTASLADNWTRERFEEVKDVLGELIRQLEVVQEVNDLEVQERLLRFIDAELQNHKPPLDESYSAPDMPNAFADDTPSYPKSLFLLQPLFTGYEMNPVAAKAQESVPIPEGLNLNAALVAPSAYANEADDAVWEASSDAEEVDLGQGGGAGMEELRRVIRESVGKEKGKKKKKRVKGSGEQETEEERQLRKAAKRERLARQKGNPYYLGNGEKKKEDEQEMIESIPIVNLDIGQEDVAPVTFAPKAQPEIVRTGEMPEGVIATGDKGVNVKKKKSNKKAGLMDVNVDISSSRTASPIQRNFQEYVVDEEEKEQLKPALQPHELAVAAPEVVSVVKVKKKKKKPAV